LNVQTNEEENIGVTPERQHKNDIETVLAGLRVRNYIVQQGGIIIIRVPEESFDEARAVWPIIQQNFLPYNIRALLVSNRMTIEAYDREDLLRLGLTRFGEPDPQDIIVGLVQASVQLPLVPVNGPIRDLLCRAAETIATMQHGMEVLEDRLMNATSYEDSVLAPDQLITRKACHNQLATMYECTKQYFIAITAPGNDASAIGERFTSMRKQALFARRFLLDTLIQDLGRESLGQPLVLLETLMLYMDHILSALNSNDRTQITMSMQAMRETMLTVEKYIKSTTAEDVQH